MSRVAVTSLVRQTGVYEPSGFLRVVDLERRRVLLATAVPESRHRARDPNPRGGLRGAKGIDVHDGRLVLANAERLFVVDRHWQLEGELTHPWFGGVHDILCDGDEGILVTCADADLLVRVAWNGAVVDRWSWRDDPRLVRELGFDEVPRFDPDLDYRDPAMHHFGTYDIVHLNSVARTRLGLVMSFGLVLAPRMLALRRARAAVARAADRFGAGGAAVRAVRRLRAARLDAARIKAVPRVRTGVSALVRLNGTAEILHRAQANAGVPNHNVLEHVGLLLYNDSNTGELVAFDPAAGTVSVRVRLPGAPTFARGLTALGNGLVLAGSQRPAAIHAIDLETKRVVWSFGLGGEPRESVYAIAVLDDDFDDAPAQLAHWAAA